MYGGNLSHKGSTESKSFQRFLGQLLLHNFLHTITICIISQNGQAHFQNLAAFAGRFL